MKASRRRTVLWFVNHLMAVYTACAVTVIIVLVVTGR